jgi:hypothetical protein
VYAECGEHRRAGQPDVDLPGLEAVFGEGLGRPFRTISMDANAADGEGERKGGDRRERGRARELAKRRS